MREVSLEPHEAVLREKGKVLARDAFTDLESLREALQRMLKGRARAPTRVRVAGSHARMFLLPWVAQLTTADRWRALAASRFEEAYGEPPEHWQVRVADDLPPRPRLAVALPAALTRVIQDTLKPRRLAIGLLDALGALLAREPAFHGCVGEIGPQNACLLMVCGGELRRVRTRRYDTADQIAATARSEWAAAGAVRAGAAIKPMPGPSVALLGAGAPVAASVASAIGGSRVLELA